MKRGGWKMTMWVSLFIGGFLLTVWVVQLLWNWLIPGIFGLAAINFYQAFGLLILCRILFKGIFFWHQGNPLNNRWANRHWKAKWNVMSDEDKEKFKQKMREKCSWYGSTDQKEG
jgi:hypothetical protein